MRVLVAHRGGLSGAERMAVRTAAALAARGDEVRLVRDRGELARTSWAPEVVHLVDLADPGFGAAAAALARRAGAGLAVTPASAPSFWGEETAAVELCRSADLLFCLTEAEWEVLRELGVAGPAVRFLPQAPALLGGGDGRRFRARHRLDGAIVLFLGRKARSKGYRELLAAAPAVWRLAPNASFVFLGPPWDEDCEDCFRRCGDPRVLDLGLVSDPEKEDALAACDLLCLPTRADVSPLVFAEAWSYGKPVLSGSFPGVGEVVENGGDGLVVDGRDPPAIAAAIVRFLRDPLLRHALGERGRAKVEARMSWEAV
ncbi:MAG TPA: glycosyltransferase family 4 protein, partial [Solirubrobacterales bacterium]